MKLYEYIIRRLLLMIFVLFSVSVIIFWLVRGQVPPAALVAAYITPKMTNVAKLAEAQGLGIATHSCPSWQDFTNKAAGCVVPLQSQYLVWLENVLKGNFGYSLIPGLATDTKTLTLFEGLFPVTAELAITALILTVLIAFPLGIISATHNNKWPDHLSRIFALSGYSIPIFWLAFVLQILFVIYLSIPIGRGLSLNLLPGSGDLATSCYLCFSNPGTAHVYTRMPMLDGILSLNFKYFWDGLVAVILPAITLAVSTIAALTRILRSSMLECLRQDYILLARSKGLRERTVVYRHALKNAILPAITITGLIFAFLLGGVVVIETIFTWPGVGRAAVEAANAFDVNFLELYVLITALIIVLANLTVDVLYAVLDPRIRY